MSSAVLDASAVLALLNQESGWEQVTEAILAGASVSAVNLSEVVARLAEAGIPALAIRGALDQLGLDIVAFDADAAHLAGFLRPVTKQAGLSLGDRACLALAQHRGLPALTADRTWQTLSLGIPVIVIR